MCLVCASYLFISIFFLLDQCVASVLLYLFFHYSRAGFRAVLNNSTHTHTKKHTRICLFPLVFFFFSLLCFVHFALPVVLLVLSSFLLLLCIITAEYLVVSFISFFDFVRGVFVCNFGDTLGILWTSQHFPCVFCVRVWFRLLILLWLCSFIITSLCLSCSVSIPNLIIISVVISYEWFVEISFYLFIHFQFLTKTVSSSFVTNQSNWYCAAPRNSCSFCPYKVTMLLVECCF